MILLKKHLVGYINLKKFYEKEKPEEKLFEEKNIFHINIYTIHILI